MDEKRPSSFVGSADSNCTGLFNGIGTMRWVLFSSNWNV
jgi:hypothetical protein